MRLYFAYGSNMDRAHMARMCPGAEPLGLVRREGHRFFIAAKGHGSIAPAPGATVHGVLWRMHERELKALDGYEDVAGGLYRRALMPVHHGAELKRAYVYVTSSKQKGKPSPAYRAMILAAARDWDLPAAYLRELERM